MEIIVGGLVVLFLYIGIDEKNLVALIFGVIIALVIIVAVWQTVKKHRKEENN